MGALSDGWGRRGNRADAETAGESGLLTLIADFLRSEASVLVVNRAIIAVATVPHKEQHTTRIA